jgi:hypothetical protein
VRRQCSACVRCIWGFGLTLLLVVTATACVSHADAHAHDLPHPFLCLDAPGAITEGQTLLRQFIVNSPLRSFLKYSALIAWSPGMTILHTVEEEAKDHPLVWSLSHLPSQPFRTLLAVLHL